MASFEAPPSGVGGAPAGGPPPLAPPGGSGSLEGHSRSDDLGVTASGSTVAAAGEVGLPAAPGLPAADLKSAPAVGGSDAAVPGSPGTTDPVGEAIAVAPGAPAVAPPPPLAAPPVAGGGPPFASAQDRVLVPREAVGFVIGKGGETIKEMMARSGAHIEVDRGDVDPATPTRVFNILGDARACAAARMLIGEKVTGVLHNKPTSAAGIPNVMLPGTANSRELWVPGDRVGSIIGARGQVVRRLQEQSGATIVIHNERVNSAAEKLVTIVGGVAETDHAASLIEDVIRKPRQPSLPSYPPALSGQNGRPVFYPPAAPARTSAGAGSSDMKTIYVPANCVGMLIGRGGDTIRELQARSGAGIRVLPSRDAASRTMDRPIFITGTPQAVEAARAIIMDVVRACASGRPGGTVSVSPLGSLVPNTPPVLPMMQSPRLDQVPQLMPPPRFPTYPPGGPSGSNMYMGMGGMPGSPMPSFSYLNAATSVTLHVPREQLGVITGRTGEIIHDLQSRSGARITIAKDVEVDIGCVTRPVTISGMASCVEMARTLVVERLTSRGDGGAPSGSGGIGDSSDALDAGGGMGEGRGASTSYDATAAGYMRNLSIGGDARFADFDRSGDRELGRPPGSSGGLGGDSSGDMLGGPARQVYGSPYLAPGGALQMVPPPMALSSPSPMGAPLGGGPFNFNNEALPYGDLSLGMYGGGQPGTYGDGGGGNPPSGPSSAAPPQRPPYGHPPVPYGSPAMPVPLSAHQPPSPALPHAQQQQAHAAREQQQQQQQAYLAQQQAGMLYYYGGYGGFMPPMWPGGMSAGPTPDTVSSPAPGELPRPTTPPGYVAPAAPATTSQPFQLQPQLGTPSGTSTAPALLPQPGDREVDSGVADKPYGGAPASRAPGARSATSSRPASASPSPPPEGLTSSFPRSVERVSPSLPSGLAASPAREASSSSAVPATNSTT